MVPLVDMKKCKRKAKDTSIQDRAPTPPQTRPWDGKNQVQNLKG
jgi:hypothetical protein